MHEFLTYFLSHMPSHEQWMAFLLVNIVAYVAARNAVLRRERRVEQRAYAAQLEQLEAQRILHIQSLQERGILYNWYKSFIYFVETGSN